MFAQKQSYYVSEDVLIIIMSIYAYIIRLNTLAFLASETSYNSSISSMLFVLAVCVLFIKAWNKWAVHLGCGIGMHLLKALLAKLVGDFAVLYVWLPTLQLIDFICLRLCNCVLDNSDAFIAKFSSKLQHCWCSDLRHCSSCILALLLCFCALKWSGFLQEALCKLHLNQLCSRTFSPHLSCQKCSPIVILETAKEEHSEC